MGSVEHCSKLEICLKICCFTVAAYNGRAHSFVYKHSKKVYIWFKVPQNDFVLIYDDVRYSDFKGYVVLYTKQIPLP